MTFSVNHLATIIYPVVSKNHIHQEFSLLPLTIYTCRVCKKKNLKASNLRRMQILIAYGQNNETNK